MENSINQTFTSTAAVFLKAPRKGTIKTRLAKTIGQQKALEAYRKMVEHQIKQIPSNWATEIHFTPSEALPEMLNWLGERKSFHPQAKGDLGVRLSEAVQTHFRTSKSALFLLGADCPWLDNKILKIAASRLEFADLILGPAFDGGYYLLGIKKCYVSLFEDITWSSEHVLTQTLKKANALNLRVEQLPKLHDVDTFAEWKIAVKQFPNLYSTYND